MTFVSVVIAARNAEPWVEQAVTSMLVQTHRELEVIVVDDASSDRTPDIVSAIKDGRLRLVRREQRGGCGRSINTGLPLAQGELIARLDADDWSLSHRLARQVAFMAANPDVGVVDSSAWLVDPRGRVFGRTREFSGRAIHYQLALDCPLIHPASMLRRSVIPPDGYPGVDTVMEDYALWLALHPTTRLEHLAEPLTFYRRHPAAIGYNRAGLQGPSEWARLMAPIVGIPIDPHVAAAWLDPRKIDGVSESRGPWLADLARRLGPARFPIGAHVPPWEPRALARARRLYAQRVIALVRMARRRGRSDVVRALSPLALSCARRTASSD